MTLHHSSSSKFFALVVIAMALLLQPATSFAFVLVSGGTKATLPVSPEQPQLNFLWNGSAPSITSKSEIAGGQYANASDSEMMAALLQLALDTWTNVEGAYIELAVTADANATMDSEDQLFAIVVEQEQNLSTAAAALPVIEETSIKDCDIRVSAHSVSAKSLAYTLIHELGHCLGLGHNHSNYNAIMGYSRSKRDLSLGNDDKAGIIYLYPDPAQGDMSSQEMISCGTTSALSANARMPITVLLFMLPLFLGMACSFINGKSISKKCR